MSLLDYLTVLAYVALDVEITIEALKIYHTKSSADLSIFGMVIRLMAIIIVLIKFASIGDIPIFIGQIVILVTFCFYLTLAVRYRLHPKKRRA
jgi:hypothetical protein